MKVDSIYTKEELIANWKDYSGGVVMVTQPLPPPTLSFIGNEGKEVFKFEANGDIYINGVLAKSDKEVVDGLVEFVNEGHKWKRYCESLELEVEALKEYKFKYEGLDK